MTGECFVVNFYTVFPIQVMDDGHVVEFDSPRILLQNKAGLFSSYIYQNGTLHGDYLRGLAN